MDIGIGQEGVEEDLGAVRHSRFVTIHLIKRRVHLLFSAAPVPAVRENTLHEQLFALCNIILWLKINSGSQLIYTILYSNLFMSIGWQTAKILVKNH